MRTRHGPSPPRGEHICNSQTALPDPLDAYAPVVAAMAAARIRAGVRAMAGPAGSAQPARTSRASSLPRRSLRAQARLLTDDVAWCRVRDVRGEEQEATIVRRLFEFRAGQHGSQGSPAPSVLDRVRMSGTTPSRSKAYQLPVRQSPVYPLGISLGNACGGAVMGAAGYRTLLTVNASWLLALLATGAVLRRAFRP
jgi:hypothetical protein